MVCMCECCGRMHVYVVLSVSVVGVCVCCVSIVGVCM